MENEAFTDRRIFERIAIKLNFRFLAGELNKEGLGQTQDISAKGVGVWISEELLPDTPLEIWLDIPDKGQPFYTRGRIVWLKKVEPERYRAGINLDKPEFMGMSRTLRLMR
ncbi:MAG: PilZ domain-containing protein [Candidatus Omnitrophica bacterium]|nr:PilZ domain-containing protein [Candidatus Omnitrophota bacterium]